MELDAVDVVGSVVQSHDQSFAAFCRYLQAVGHALTFYNPAVVSSHREAFRQTGKQRRVGKPFHSRGDTMEHVGQVRQSGTENFGDGLMSQAYAQDGLYSCIMPDDLLQQTGL